jgi:hypothetical protein
MYLAYDVEEPGRRASKMCQVQKNTFRFNQYDN